MKKMWKIVLTCIFIYTISFGMTAVIMGIETDDGEMASLNDTPTVSTVSNQPCYTVKEYEGLVAVYLNDELLPLIETDICVSGLRQNDRELMEQGITLGSYTEVLYLLEDFGS